MRLAWFAFIALLLCVLQHGPLAAWPVAPDLPLALAAWAMVDGDDEGVLLRAWLVGVVRDLVDPGTAYGRECFHAIAYGLLGVAYTPVRSWLFRSRALGWGGWGCACSLAVALVDHRLASAPVAWGHAALEAGLTGAAAMALGWLLGGLPGTLRPVEAGAA